MVTRDSSKVQSRKREPATDGSDAGKLEVDVDLGVRVKGTGKFTRAEIAAVISALAALGWAAIRFL
jgi:hypothetical protein